MRRLTAIIRSRTHKDFKNNFSNLYGKIQCPLDGMEKGGDTFKNTKEHILECCKISEKLNTAKILDGNIQYSDLFQSDTRKLKALSTLFIELVDINKYEILIRCVNHCMSETEIEKERETNIKT